HTHASRVSVPPPCLRWRARFCPGSPRPRLARHSFPTRRSSDLARSRGGHAEDLEQREDVRLQTSARPQILERESAEGERLPLLRSEEHTSELQSRSDLVCRLLLEKKNRTKARPHARQTNSIAPH